MVGERFDNLPIYKLQKDWPLVDQRNIGSQCSHKGCVLEAHHPGSHDDDLFRKTNQGGKMVCIHNWMVVKRNRSAVRGSRAASDQDLRPFDSGRFTVALNFHCMVI